MTNEDAIKIIQNEYKCVDRECDIEKSCGKCPYMMPSKEPILKAYDMAIQALSQEPYGDAISREAAITIAGTHTLTVDETVKALERLPSVTQKSGKWKHEQFPNFKVAWFCNKCGGGTYHKTNYCPNCGAKMESEE